MVNQAIVIDWFAITVWDSSDMPYSAMDFVTQILGFTKWGKLLRGSRGYQFRQDGLEGANLYSQVIDKQHGEHNHLELTGEACAIVDWSVKLNELFMFLTRRGLKYRVTRLDIALDHQKFMPVDVWKASQDGDIKTRVRRKSITRVHDVDDIGDTVYVGSKASQTFIRFYKKVVENHPIFADSVFCRCETIYKDERATNLFSVLANVHPSEWLKWSRSTLNAYFSVLTNWWATWLEDLNQGALLRLQQKPKSLQKTAKWLHTQVAASLKMFIDAMSSGDADGQIEEMRKLLEVGRERMSESHFQILDYHFATVDVEDNYGVLVPRVVPDVELSVANNARLLDSVDKKREQWKRDHLVAWFRNLVQKRFPHWENRVHLWGLKPELVGYQEEGFLGKIHWGYSIDWDYVEECMRDDKVPENLDTPKQLMFAFAADDSTRKRVNHWD